MHRKFITAIAVTSILITGLGALPARAETNDTAKVMAAILGIAVVGAVIHDHKKDKKREHAHTVKPVPQPYQEAHGNAHHIKPRPVPQPYQQAHGSSHHIKPRPLPQPYQETHGSSHHIQPRPLPHRARKHVLPSRCLRSVETRRGNKHILGQRCLERHYRFAHRLPQRCERQVRTNRGVRYGYGVRCLRREGYELARR